MRHLLLALALGVSCSFASRAHADVTPKAGSGRAAASSHPSEAAPDKLETVVEVSVLHGTHDEKGSDARIGNMPELSQGPFAKYASYQLLSRAQLKLDRGTKRQLKLPNGRLLQTRLEDILPDGSRRLVASINRPDASDFLPLLEVKARPGQSFIVAGQSYRRGILVLVFRIVR